MATSSFLLLRASSPLIALTHPGSHHGCYWLAQKMEVAAASQHSPEDLKKVRPADRAWETAANGLHHLWTYLRTSRHIRSFAWPFLVYFHVYSTGKDILPRPAQAEQHNQELMAQVPPKHQICSSCHSCCLYSTRSTSQIGRTLLIWHILISIEAALLGGTAAAVQQWGGWYRCSGSTEACWMGCITRTCVSRASLSVYVSS